MAERILPTETQAPASAPHAYNDPSLSATEFLTHVMHATHLPIASRVQAAAALLPFTTPSPRSVRQGYVPYRCKIIIGGLGPDPGSTENHSQNRVSPEIPVTRDDDTLAPLNIEKTPDPPNLPDYSTPPTPQELAEIHAAISALRPDLAHLPLPELHQCPCGHWLTFECNCCYHDPSKLN